ncbi:MAG: aminoacyl-tRNA hydrolase [Crocinitomicaceae bacterium]|nr:aminoacyl-tRNA hydrolase [Crocinitomicaceae bacterium]
MDQVISELQFETSRSSGKGGQHVNKTESKVTAVFDLRHSLVFTDKEKELLKANLRGRIQNGVIRVSSQESRSQHRNKQISIQRLLDLLDQGLIAPKVRKERKVTKSQKENRLKAKKQHAEKKSLRKKIRKEDY